MVAHCSYVRIDYYLVNSRPSQSDLCTIPDIDEFWELIGTRLHVDKEALETIRRKSSNLSRRKRLMFKKVLENGVTWGSVLHALDQLSLHSSIQAVCNLKNLKYDDIHRSAATQPELVPVSFVCLSWKLS